jgi:hypothetical protein
MKCSFDCKECNSEDYYWSNILVSKICSCFQSIVDSFKWDTFCTSNQISTDNILFHKLYSISAVILLNRTIYNQVGIFHISEKLNSRNNVICILNSPQNFSTFYNHLRTKHITSCSLNNFLIGTKCKLNSLLKYLQKPFLSYGLFMEKLMCYW